MIDVELVTRKALLNGWRDAVMVPRDPAEA